jgi:hypothetical protein
MSNLESEVQALKDEVKQLMSEVFKIQRQANSRVGLQGGRGEKGDRGSDGRNAVLILKVDGKENVIRLFDEKGEPVGTITTIPGKDGKDGVSPTSLDIAELVRKEFKAWMARL